MDGPWPNLVLKELRQCSGTSSCKVTAATKRAELSGAAVKKNVLTCEVWADKCRPIYLPQGAVLYLNGHGLKVCPRADSNKLI
jgi:hypothetical protein